MSVEKEASLLWPMLVEAWRGRNNVSAELAEVHNAKYEAWGMIMYGH